MPIWPKVYVLVYMLHYMLLNFQGQLFSIQINSNTHKNYMKPIFKPKLCVRWDFFCLTRFYQMIIFHFWFCIELSIQIPKSFFFESMCLIKFLWVEFSTSGKSKSFARKRSPSKVQPLIPILTKSNKSSRQTL